MSLCGSLCYMPRCSTVKRHTRHSVDCGRQTVVRHWCRKDGHKLPRGHGHCRGDDAGRQMSNDVRGASRMTGQASTAAEGRHSAGDYSFLGGIAAGASDQHRPRDARNYEMPDDHNKYNPQRYKPTQPSQCLLTEIEREMPDDNGLHYSRLHFIALHYTWPNIFKATTVGI